MTTRRSYRYIDNRVEMPKETEDSEKDENSREDEPIAEPKDIESVTEPRPTIGDASPSESPPRTYITKAPYSQRLRSAKSNAQLD